MNFNDLNKYLSPYGVQYGDHYRNDIVRLLREFGIDARSSGSGKSWGMWIENGLLSSEVLKKFVFSITTNPYLSKEEATKLLQSLEPFATKYQENLLKSNIEEAIPGTINHNLQNTFLILNEAISYERRVAIAKEYFRTDKENHTANIKIGLEILFTPKWIVPTQETVYVAGYNHNKNKVKIIDFNEIASIQLRYKNKVPTLNKINDIFSEIDPYKLVPQRENYVIYRGPIEFFCRGKYLKKMYYKFGPPSSPIIKTSENNAIYHVKNAEITSETLYWLSQVKEYGIRIKGPESAVEYIKQYYADIGTTLVKAYLPNKRYNCKTKKE